LLQFSSSPLRYYFPFIVEREAVEVIVLFTESNIGRREEGRAFLLACLFSFSAIDTIGKQREKVCLIREQTKKMELLVRHFARSL
jgi:hypothetical protein